MRWLLASSALTLIAFFMQMIAQGWLIYDLTGAAAWIGIVALSGDAAALLLSVPIGASVDRFGPRSILLLCHVVVVVATLTLVGLIWSGLVQAWHMAAVAAIDVPCLVAMGTARQAMLPALTNGQVQRGTGALGVVQSGGRLIGPLVAGWLLGWFGVGGAFLAQAAVLVAAFACAVAIPAIVATGAHERVTGSVSDVFGVTGMVSLMGLHVLAAVLLVPFAQFIPVLAVNLWHEGVGAYSVAAAVMGAGGIMGALIATKTRSREHRSLLVYLLVGYGCGVFALATVRDYWHALMFMAGLGFVQSCYVAISGALVLASVPKHLHGRAVGLMGTIIGLVSLSTLLQGWLADLVGISLVLQIAGASSVVLLLLGVGGCKVFNRTRYLEAGQGEAA